MDNPKKIFFLSDDINLSYMIQGFVENYFKNYMEFENIVIAPNEVSTNDINRNLNEAIQIMKEIGIVKFDYEKANIISINNFINFFNLLDSKKIIFIFRSEKFLTQIKKEILPLESRDFILFTLILPFPFESQIDDYFDHLKALRQNRNTIGTYIRTYALNY